MLRPCIVVALGGNAQRRLVTVLTQVEVDGGDPAFGEPDKPVGRTLAREQAEKPGHARDGQG